MNQKFIPILITILLVIISIGYMLSYSLGNKSCTYVVAAYDSVGDDADYFCDGIDDQVQIASAMAAANPGGRVILLEGHYNVTAINCSDLSVVVCGQGVGTIIKVRNQYNSYLTSDAFSGQTWVNVSDASGFHIDEFVALEDSVTEELVSRIITNIDGNTIYFGVSLVSNLYISNNAIARSSGTIFFVNNADSANNLTFRDMTIDNNRDNYAVFSYTPCAYNIGIAQYSTSSEYITIQNILFKNGRSVGVSSHGGNHIRIMDCMFINNYGITTETGACDVLISGNTFQNCSGGMYLAGIRRAIISENIIHIVGTYSGLAVIGTNSDGPCSDIVVKNNYLEGCPNGMTISGTGTYPHYLVKRATVSGNIIKSPYNYGMVLSLDGGVVSDNTIWDSDFSAMISGSCNRTIIAHNVIKDCNSAQLSSPNGAGIYFSNSSRIITLGIFDNIIEDTTGKMNHGISFVGSGYTNLNVDGNMIYGYKTSAISWA